MTDNSKSKQMNKINFMWCIDCLTFYEWNGRFIYCPKCHGDLVADYGRPSKKRTLYNAVIIRGVYAK